MKKVKSAIARVGDYLWPPTVHVAYECGKCTLKAEISGDEPYVLSTFKVIIAHKCSAVDESE